MKTVLITGCSSGFGLETARLFLSRGWKVVATMRSPQKDLLPPSDHLRILPLDITNVDSVAHAVQAAGPIDALVNNAGVGLLSILEGTTLETTRDVFETNTFGAISMIQAVLPQFRSRRAGTIVNVTSATTMKPLPLLSIYTASKAAVNAYTESLALELKQFNVQVNLVIPGRSPETPFSKNAQPRMQGGIPEAYAEFAHSTFDRMRQSTGPVTYASDVAEAIWKVVNDPSSPIRVPAGADAEAMAEHS